MKRDSVFQNRGVLRGNIRLFGPADAIDIIRQCRDNRIPLLGIDAFFDRPDGLQPSMDHSVDFTSERDAQPVESRWSRGEEFIDQRRTMPFLFELVIQDLDYA